MERRIDHYTAMLIDSLLENAEKMGIQLSATSLMNLGIDPETAERIARTSNMRRGFNRMNGNPISA